MRLCVAQMDDYLIFKILEIKASAQIAKDRHMSGLYSNSNGRLVNHTKGEKAKRIKKNKQAKKSRRKNRRK